MKIATKACRYDAPLLAVLKIHFAKIIAKFFQALRDTLPSPTLGHGLNSQYPLGWFRGKVYHYLPEAFKYPGSLGQVHILEFVPEARNECRVRIGSLSEQVVRHVPSLLCTTTLFAIRKEPTSSLRIFSPYSTHHFPFHYYISSLL